MRDMRAECRNADLVVELPEGVSLVGEKALPIGNGYSRYTLKMPVSKKQNVVFSFPPLWIIKSSIMSESHPPETEHIIFSWSRIVYQHFHAAWYGSPSGIIESNSSRLLHSLCGIAPQAWVAGLFLRYLHRLHSLVRWHFVPLSPVSHGVN